jgi:5'-nucleotidase
MGGKVDLVVSGINHGANLGSDIIYSGTVAAALDAVIMGYKALAVSCASEFAEHFDTAAETVARLIDGGLFDEESKDVLLNLNVPNVPMSELKGVKAAIQGRTAYDDSVELRDDPRGREYIWVTGTMREHIDGEETDLTVVRNGYASLTPIKFDLTARDKIESLSCKIDKIKLHF